MPKLLSCILFTCILWQHATSQSVADTSQGNNAIVLDTYFKSLGEQSPLYNGSEYLEYAYTLQEGHPFYGPGGWITGTIIFDGIQFQNVAILYDIIKDQVVIQDYRKINKINLPAERIREFTLSSHTFIHIPPDSANGLKAGFYDQLYNKKTGLFAKREKKILQKNVDLKENSVVVIENLYYIKKDGRYHFIKNKASMLEALKDKRKDVQQFLKKQGVRFKDDPEKAMYSAVQFYDQITN